MARPSGYGSSGAGTGSKGGAGGKKSCIIVKVWSAKKWSLVSRALANPAYGLRAWQHFCAIPVAA